MQLFDTSANVCLIFSMDTINYLREFLWTKYLSWEEMGKLVVSYLT